MATAHQKPTAPNFQDLTGQVFCRLTVIAYAGRSPSRKHRWLCRCECGAEVIIERSCLKSGHTSSCGCLAKELAKTRELTHGRSGTKDYKAWAQMVQRCHNPNDSSFHKYGGRGIEVCDRWRYSFELFIADLGERPSRSHTIERINNDGNYEPGNCRWATQAEQARNRRSSCLITLNGVTLCLKDWAKRTGLSRNMISRRLALGFSTEDALTMPRSAGARRNKSLTPNRRNAPPRARAVLG